MHRIIIICTHLRDNEDSLFCILYSNANANEAIIILITIKMKILITLT